MKINRYKDGSVEVTVTRVISEGDIIDLPNTGICDPIEIVIHSIGFGDYVTHDGIYAASEAYDRYLEDNSPSSSTLLVFAEFIYDTDYRATDEEIYRVLTIEDLYYFFP